MKIFKRSIFGQGSPITFWKSSGLWIWTTDYLIQIRSMGFGPELPWQGPALYCWSC